MGAFTGPIKFVASVGAICTAFYFAAGLIKDHKIDPAVDADGDGKATLQEYGGKAMELTGDAIKSGIKVFSGAADKLPETAADIYKTAEEEFDLPDITTADKNSSTLRTADDWRKGLCREDQSDKECIEAAFDHLDNQ